MLTIYLAGPEVFHRDAVAIGARKRDLCAQYGFEGLYPIDAEAGPLEGDKAEQSKRIFGKNIDLIERSSVCIANLSPFKGIDADPGSAWELGYAFARGKKIFGYSNSAEELLARDQTLSAIAAGDPAASADLARLFPTADTQAEDFGRSMNLMMVESILAAGGFIEAAEKRRFDDLEAFERVLARLAQDQAGGASRD